MNNGHWYHVDSNPFNIDGIMLEMLSGLNVVVRMATSLDWKGDEGGDDRLCAGVMIIR